MERSDEKYEKWFVSMVEKRFDELDEIAKTITTRQYVSMILMEKQLAGFFVTDVEFTDDGREEYIRFIHRESGKKIIIGIPLVDEEIPVSTLDAINEEADLIEAPMNDLSCKRSTLENLLYWSNIEDVACLPGFLERLKVKVIKCVAPYDEVYLGEYNGVSISVIDVMTKMNEIREPLAVARRYKEYEDVHIKGFEWTKSKDDTQKILASFILELCGQVSRVVLHGVGINIPGFDCLRDSIKPYIESGKVHINPVGYS